MKRNVLYSEEKEKRRVNVLYRKIQLRKLKEIIIDKKAIEKRKQEAEINKEEINDRQEVEEAFKKLKKNRKKLLKKKR